MLDMLQRSIPGAQYIIRDEAEKEENMRLFAANEIIGSVKRVLFISMFISGLMAAGMVSDAHAGWPVVLRPGVNAGTGTADYNVSLFAPVIQTDDSMIFLTPNFRINDGTDENELNVGVGYRKLLGGGDWYMGVNAFFDTIRSRHSHDFRQLGIGLEARSKWVDVIFNGHIAADDRNEEVHDNDRTTFGFPIVTRNGKEEQLPGIEGEVGFLIPGVSDFVETHVYVGGYHWKSKLIGDIGGVKARVEVMPIPFVTLNATYDYDSEWESTWRGEAYLNVPFDLSGGNPFAGIGDYFKFGQGARDVSARMTDRVERDRYIIVVEGHDPITRIFDERTSPESF